MRYFNTRLYNIPKSSHWYYEILPSYDDKCSRFVSLKGCSVKKVKHLILFADCAIILHNFLELNGEIWDLDLNFEDENENQEFEEDDDNEELKLIGQQKRNDIMQQCIG